MKYAFAPDSDPSESARFDSCGRVRFDRTRFCRRTAYGAQVAGAGDQRTLRDCLQAVEDRSRGLQLRSSYAKSYCQLLGIVRCQTAKSSQPVRSAIAADSQRARGIRVKLTRA